MNIERFSCPGSFLNHAAPYLETQEALNNLLLGVLVRLAEEHCEDKAFMATVQQDATIALAGLYFQINLLISHGDVAAIPALTEELLMGGWKIPGVLGPSDLVESFASFWAGSRGCTSTLWVQQRIFRLDQVQWTSDVPGASRLAEAADIPLLMEWYRQFDEEIRKGDETISPEEALKNAKKRVLGRKTYFWIRNGTPVSMASQARPTANGIAINGVFTPPGNRCQGNASALVAAVSQMSLDAGKKFCTLYTDTDNPTSNSIYQKIGYKPVGDATDYRFEYPDLH